MVETEWCSSLWEVIYPMRLEQKEWGRKNSISHQTLQSTCLTSHQPPALIEHILHFPLATSPYRTHASLPISHQSLQSTCLTSHQPPALTEDTPHFPPATSPYRAHASLPISHQSLQSTCLTSHQPPALIQHMPHFPLHATHALLISFKLHNLPGSVFFTPFYRWGLSLKVKISCLLAIELVRGKAWIWT